MRIKSITAEINCLVIITKPGPHGGDSCKINNNDIYIISTRIILPSTVYNDNNDVSRAIK